MNINIRYATEADAPAIAKLNIICFQNTPFSRNVYRGIDQLSAIPMKIARCYNKFSDPRMHLLVATDPASNAILGCARWGIPDANRSENEMPVLSDEARALAAQTVRPAGMNAACYEAGLKLLEETRGRHVREDDVGEFFSAIDHGKG
jgi:hypothetical protein